MELCKVEPILDKYWRAIILFGRKVVSYKFALARSLYEMNVVTDDLVALEQLTELFSRHLCEHLKHSSKQYTSRSGKFLTSCSDFNVGEISYDELIMQTVKLGFVNVIDEFHVVNSGEVEKQSICSCIFK
jgi:hypothetical protein